MIIQHIGKFVFAILAGGAAGVGMEIGRIFATHTANIYEDFFNYTLFDVENGWDKDFPELKDIPPLKKVLYTMFK